MPEIFLKVDSAYPGDQGGGKARLDPETMLYLKISPVDIVAVEGKRRTVAKVWRSLDEDWNQNKVRIDNFTRTNAGVSIGDTVRISPIKDEIESRRVVLAPGFAGFDAVHVACAESGKADVFLTTDDRLLKLAKRLAKKLHIKVENPLDWMKEMI